MLIDTAAGISANVLYFNINSDEILVVATPEPTSITDAYAMMKVLSVKHSTDRFNLVVNAAASAEEAEDVFRQLSLVADRFLNISMEYYGCILLDENVRKGVRHQKAVTDMAPVGQSQSQFHRSDPKNRGCAGYATPRSYGGLVPDGDAQLIRK